MKKILIISLLLSGSSCNPYRPYYFTHYHISASYDPETHHLSANVQMVFVPSQAYHDSITFQLNESMEIQSMAAQELRYYEFDSGRLVLYIKGSVKPGDQLHVSLAYQGLIEEGNGLGRGLTPGNLWYPVNPATDKLTYSVEMCLPEHYRLDKPWIRKGHCWHSRMQRPLGEITVPFRRE